MLRLDHLVQAVYPLQEEILSNLYMQTAYKLFEKETLIKIAKGIAVYAVGSAALGVLALLSSDFLASHGLNNPMLLAFIAWVTPSATKVVKEWMAGNA